MAENLKKDRSVYQDIARIKKDIIASEKELGREIKVTAGQLKSAYKAYQSTFSIVNKLGPAGKAYAGAIDLTAIASSKAALAMKEQTPHVMGLLEIQDDILAVVKENATLADELSLFGKERLPYEEKLNDIAAESNQLAQQHIDQAQELVKIKIKERLLATELRKAEDAGNIGYRKALMDKKEALVLEKESLQTQIEEGAQRKDALDDSVGYYKQEQKTRMALDKRKELMEGFTSIFGKSLSDVKALGKTITGFIFNPLTAVVAVGGFLVKQFVGMIKSSFKMQKELGVGAGHAMGLNIATREAAAGGFLYGESLEDTTARASTLVDEWGIINSETKNAVMVVTDLERNYGVAATSAAAVAQMMEATSSSTKDVLLSGMTDQMKELQSQGIPVGKVMEDVASDTDFFAKFMKQGGKNVIKAAAFAKKLGMSMSTISGSASALLDWEESINAEMEASVLLGREVNMERARELAFAGDLEGMQKEIMRQVGSEADFNRMNVVQREALAAAAGLSLTDLTKMVSAEEKLSKMTGKERKEHEKAQKVTSNMQKLWNGLVGIFRYMYKKLITPIANAFMRMLGINIDLASGAGNFEGVLAKVREWADKIVTSFETWLKGGGLEKIKNFFVMIWNTAKMIGGVLLSIGSYLGEHKGLLTIIVGLWAANKLGLFSMLGGLGKFGKGLSGIGKAAKKIPGDGKEGIMSKIGGKGGGTTMIKGAVAMVIMAAATWVMAKALQEFSDVKWKAVAMGIVSLIALAGVAILLGMFAPVSIAGAAAMVVLAGAMWVLGKAMQEFAKAAVILIPVLDTLFKGISLVISTIADAFVSMLDAIVISFKSFAAMGREGGLLSAAAGMTAISVALGLFGGGSLLAGIGSAIGDFFGGDPIDKFQRFGALGPGLDQTSTAIGTLKTNMQAFQSIGIRDMADSTNQLAKALTALAKASHKVNKAQRAALRTQALKGIGQWLGIIDENAPNAPGGGGGGGSASADVAELQRAIKEQNAILIQMRDNANRHSQDNVSAVEGASAQR